MGVGEVLVVRVIAVPSGSSHSMKFGPVSEAALRTARPGYGRARRPIPAIPDVCSKR
jgi:hypothetical protein